MRRLLFSRWARSLAIVGVYLLTLQSMGLPRFALDSAQDCCCHARSASCHCPICSHARALESGHPLLQTCGSSSSPVAVIVLDPSLPAAEPQPAPRLAAEVPCALTPRLVQDPPREVPTPPPLASSV
jgi:hypothetical protein